MTPDELREWRQALKLTQGEAANIFGVTTRGYAKWEAGEAPIDERTDLAAKQYLRIHRSRHGFNGRPLLYVVRTRNNADLPDEVYLVIARDEFEAGRLVMHDLKPAPESVNVDAEAVADAPPDAKPRVLGTLSQLIRTRRVKFI